MSFPVLALIVSILVLSCKSEDSSAVCQGDNLMTEIENKLNDINCKLDSIQKDCCNAAKTPPNSCSDVKANDPNSKSGYYNIRNKNGTVERVYCYMEELCNSTGWMRVAHLDMRNSMESCPTEFKLRSSNGVRACGRPGGGCAGKTFATNDIAYVEVCGKLIGYQVGLIDGASTSYGPDTVTLSHGTKRNKIWTFYSGSFKNGTYSTCPCGIRHSSVPEPESNSYYCEAGSQDTPQSGKFYPEERLWDGEGCGPVETDCCKRPDMPWFYKPIGSSTTDYIEIRICGTEGAGEEDIPLEQYEIYVK